MLISETDEGQIECPTLEGGKALDSCNFCQVEYKDYIWHILSNSHSQNIRAALAEKKNGGDDCFGCPHLRIFDDLCFYCKIGLGTPLTSEALLPTIEEEDGRIVPQRVLECKAIKYHGVEKQLNSQE